ncbi:MAG: TIGR04282 family arsenosugar biosynthesis glycosyltransferase [Pyrinomonadaceae bacterium]|nr:TIGR04282 family arsenosugar biosynthesis glycosyltransferase [Pyrinomonadaceae bacterium]
MAKVPVAGTVKTRLQPFLSPAECAGLAAAFLRDAENKAKTVCKKTILAYSPVDQKIVLENILQSENILVEQRGTDLGARMSAAFEFAFTREKDSAVVMFGTDSPTFPAKFIERAFEFLETNADAVMGKSADGGFYLIGLRRFTPHLFENIEWSVASVFEQMTANFARFKFHNLRLIPDWYDVDTPDDFLRLRDEMLKDEEARKCAPQTFQWLTANAEIFDKNSNSFSENKF